MSETKKIKIGLFGFGVVGQGVWKNIEKNRASLESKLGCQLEITSIVVNDLSKKRKINVEPDILHNDSSILINDSEIDIFCELIGGTQEALDITKKLLNNGKVVITANKALICEYGEELFKIAEDNGGHYFYEASVAGGIPIIKTLRESLVANNFSLIFGVLNGTSNYILTRMREDQLSFEKTLGDARRLGYVEADEALDIDGIDAGHKVVILTYLAHKKWINLDQIICEGIRNISVEDIKIADDLGFKIKLLGIIARDFETNEISVRLHPAFISKSQTIANVDEVYNGIHVTGDVVGTSVLIGKGAGQDATASSVISDIADAAEILDNINNSKNNLITSYQKDLNQSLKLTDPSDLQSRYYFRFHVKNEEGALAKISKLLANYHISFSTVTQKELSDETALIMVTTHKTKEASVNASFQDLETESIIIDKPVYIRIFDPILV